MNERFKWLGRTLLQGLIWVFILSIQWHGQPLFVHAHSLVVDNSVVHSLDSNLNDVWHRLKRAAQVAFAKNTPDSEQAL